jgi:phage tail sheath gpL-like
LCRKIRRSFAVSVLLFTAGLFGTPAEDALRRDITINGISTVTTATPGGNTAQQNAASIAADINGTTGTTVTATGNGDGTITLTHKTLGSSYTINITEAGTGTGLTVAVLV